PFDHEEPFWFFVPELLLGMLPWSLLVIPLFRLLADKSARVAAERPAGLGFFLLCFAWGLLFFSAAGCKRSGYILPAMPPLALALGCLLNVALHREAGRLRELWLHARVAGFGHRVTTFVLCGGLGSALLALAAGQLSQGRAAVLVASLLLGL